jgi:hypothetical protein
MSHLSRDHLLAFVEDPHTRDMPAERRRHLEACASCQSEVADLRALLTDIREEPGGSPSPLFWDHCAARVADAIRDEAPEPAARVRAWGFGGHRAAWMAVAATVLLGSTMVAWRATLQAPAVPATVAATEDSPRGDDLEDDQAWKVLRAAADGLPWEDVQAAGIAARPGSAEGVVMELTADERAELARLLETEMKRSGV